MLKFRAQNNSNNTLQGMSTLSPLSVSVKNIRNGQNSGVCLSFMQCSLATLNIDAWLNISGLICRLDKVKLSNK